MVKSKTTVLLAIVLLSAWSAMAHATNAPRCKVADLNRRSEYSTAIGASDRFERPGAGGTNTTSVRRSSLRRAYHSSAET